MGTGVTAWKEFARVGSHRYEKERDREREREWGTKEEEEDVARR